ncbi:hypothetical protein [Undibacterium sp. RuRC25W]|uniref:hypothetical protein n=1 Tax=Undibacterium sp. RuRC25W TaxID=3413047 RepID=UPI003BF10D02
MPSIAMLESSQRLIIVAITSWFLWALLSGINAPYNPSGPVLTIFFYSAIMTYLACIWIGMPLVSSKVPVLLRILLLNLIALGPFFTMLMVGHFIVIEIKILLS